MKITKNKNNFIKELLEDKKINQNQRERIFELASREFSIEGSREERVEKIEEMLFNKKNTKSKKKHNPKEVVKKLKLFTLDNSTLKYSTHLWDEGGLFLSFEDFTKRLDNELVKYKIHELQYYNSDLYWNKLYPFLFQKELTEIQKKGATTFGWGQHKILLGWQYPDIIKNWCVENYDNKGNNASLPFSMRLPDEFRPQKTILGKTIVSFEDVVNIFKKEIEFRDNDLFVAVKGALRKEMSDYEINDNDLESLKGCSFYSNTEYVIKAIIRIFWMIKSRSASRKIKISCKYIDNSNVYDFEIIHVNSFSDKEIAHPKLMLKEETGDLSILRTTLQSLCDFSITSRFKDTNNDFINAKIEYLYYGVDQKNWEPKIRKITEPITGFKFNLKFPVL